jgi:pyruvate/2-oxoglutarate/acetoin dehydrogenase E1 component
LLGYTPKSRAAGELRNHGKDHHARGYLAGLVEEMERDERVFILGEEVAYGWDLRSDQGFYDHFGEKRVRDTPIAESVIVGCAIGAA